MPEERLTVNLIKLFVFAAPAPWPRITGWTKCITVRSALPSKAFRLSLGQKFFKGGRLNRDYVGYEVE